MASPLEPRISVVIRNVSWVGIIAHTLFIPLFIWLGHPRLAAFNVLSVATWVAAKVLSQRGRHTPAMWFLFVEVAVHAAIATTTLGWESGFQYYLIPLIPFVMFNDRLSGTTVSLASVLVFLGFVGLRITAPHFELDPRVELILTYGNIGVPFTALALVTYYFRLASVDAEARMARMAATDPLTGLHNRRQMDQLLRDAVDRAARGGMPFSLIMADVDAFKRINDELGHDAGDRVLGAVAKVFGGQLRATDAVARWGGEEFLVLLADSSPEHALEVAQRLRAAAERQLHQLAQLPTPVTVTLGVATHQPRLSVAGLLKLADEALYKGKAAGRNQVAVEA